MDMIKTNHNIESITESFFKLSNNEINEEIRLAIEFAKQENSDLNLLNVKLSGAFIISKICIREINLDDAIVITCILYFTIPAEKIDLKKLDEVFGQRVKNILHGLIKTSDIQLGKLSIQAENFIKLLLTISPDITSILVKLAEMLYLIRNLKNEEVERQVKIASVVSALYAPIAHRLGLYSIKTEMEDLSMKYLHPKVYKDIAKKLEQTKAYRDKYIKSFIHPLKKELDKQKIKCEIKGRPKSIHSIWNKMRTQGVDFEEVYDKFAIRVIIDSEPENEKTDCWRVYSIITDWYKT
jgi:guanosine-3',5'-bis(diphosphate) 3'-pyrophosphohydrolase